MKNMCLGAANLVFIFGINVNRKYKTTDLFRKVCLIHRSLSNIPLRKKIEKICWTGR